MSQYIVPSDLTLYAINSFAIQQIPQTDQVNACIAASEVADSYLRGRYPLPLLAWGADIKMHVAYIAVYYLMSARGFNPNQSGGDEIIKDRYYESVGYPDKPGSGWFPMVQRQAIHPDVTVSTPTIPKYQFPAITTGRARGWTRAGRW